MLQIADGGSIMDHGPAMHMDGYSFRDLACRWRMISPIEGFPHLVHEQGSETDPELCRDDADPALSEPAGGVEPSNLGQPAGGEGREQRA